MNAVNQRIPDTVVFSNKLHSGSRAFGEKIYTNLFLKSATFRLVFSISLLYFMIFGIAWMCSWEIMQMRMLDRIDRSLSNHYEQIISADSDLGPEALLTVANAENAVLMKNHVGFYLTDKNGRRIAGNLPKCTIKELGRRVVPAADLGIDDGGNYRLYSKKLNGNTLTLAASMQPINHARELAIQNFGIAFIVSTLLSLIGSIYFSRQMQRRVNSIEESMDRFAAGDLQARIPISSKKDDFDCFSEKMNRTLSQLEKNVESVQQVSSDIAHELKTPLNRLYIHLETLADKNDIQGTQSQELDEAIEETRKINNIFQALLRIAQLEAGLRREKFKHFNLVDQLDTLVEVYNVVAEEQGSHVELALDTHLPMPVLGDKDLVVQMLANLIENSISHCASGTKVKVSAGINKQGTWLQVEDNGVGVPDYLHEKLFQRLYRVESSRTTSGTGLGLSLVKVIAELHGCDLSTINCHPGFGVRLVFREEIK